MEFTRRDLDRISHAYSITEALSQFAGIDINCRTRTGKRVVIRCPFADHEDRHPSFVIYQNRRFCCFGCHRSGDVFTLVQELTGWNFLRTVRTIARLSGINPATMVQDRMKNDRLLDRQSHLYNRQLANCSKTVSLYLAKRGFSVSQLVIQGIGFASSALHTHSYESLEKNSAPFSSSGYIVFPLVCVSGHTEAFLTRTVGTGMPKYRLNQYLERRPLFYGAPEAWKAITAAGRTILVEGPFDALAFVVSGEKAVLAECGCYLSEAAIALLKRQRVQCVYLCLDNDPAGRIAERRQVLELMQAGMTVFIGRYTAKDPAECHAKAMLSDIVWLRCNLRAERDKNQRKRRLETVKYSTQMVDNRTILL